MLNRYKYTVFLMGWLILLAGLSLAPTQSVSPPRSIPHIDKIVHFVFYLVFTILLFRALYQEWKISRKIKWIYFTSFFISFIVGSSIEYLQETITKTRSGDFFDLVANTFGTIVALFFVTLFRK